MLNFIHVFGLVLFTLIFKYIFLKDFYFYFDDWSLFANFEETNSIFPVFTDRPLAGLFLVLMFQIFKWNPIPYHILGAIFEIIANLTVYYVCDNLIWHNKFYSSLTVLLFLLMPGHSQQYWWITLLSLKILLVIWLSSIYLFNKFIITNETKYLFWSSFAYGITLFWYELAILLPLIHALLYIKFVILKIKKIDWIRLIKIFSVFSAYIFIFLLFRFTKSFGLSAQFNRSGIIGSENIFIRTQKILISTFLSYPNMDYNIGLQAFKNSHIIWLSTIITSLIIVFLMITWFFTIFKYSQTSRFFTKSEYIFIFVLSIFLCLYPLIPFCLSSAWFDTRHTYLPHFGFAVLLVLMIRGLLEIVQKLNQKGLQYAIIFIFLFCLSKPLVNNAESMIGLGTIWRQVGLDLKNYETIVKKEFPTVQPQTLFLIKDAETLREGVPVFSGNWVVSGFFRKIYPLQKVQGDFYNAKSPDEQGQLILFKINPDLKSILLGQSSYLFNKIIILDGKNQLQPFSAINIKTHQGNYLKQLQTSNSNIKNSPSSILEISIR
ncbi:hypothetical protein [Nostoc sphaeroides]|uniref:Glycosyltransferase RgtA/B/C/D-like domain-containing protein n=1 Tax=Nostoc sphaeroides CCNUC1 TaxID=2653204 RepID=A0A5P8VYZ8_9NOSO|nr:hypothetical protein [Nostoc sphaeroides]QFS45336.1 hypothetical protein GXM_02813 [Nostoc sphaeroides CCNUC1]